MITTALITEYNPFHLGHNYHLNQSKVDTNSDITIAIMSGNFMQRGTPAIIDKWERAKMAVLNGVDLVIELPLAYATSSAEIFAFGAVSILNKLKIVDYVYFGSEYGDISKLRDISNILVKEPLEFKELLKKHLSQGTSFHKSRELTLIELFNDEEISNIICSSNNILGIEYMKALIKLNSPITPKTLKRVGNNYNDKTLSNSFSSATSIRVCLKSSSDIETLENTLPSHSIDILKNLKHKDYKFIFDEDMFKFIKYKILTQGNNLSKLLDIGEGLDNKFINEIVNSNSLDEFILNSKSKRYTYTKINRLLTAFFIGLEQYNVKELINNTPNYIRPLAFNSKGAKFLKEVKNIGEIDVIANVPKHHNHPHLNLDILGTKAYSVLNPSISPIEDYLRRPFILK